MILDSRLNQDEQIDRKRDKEKRALNIIKIVAGKKWGEDKDPEETITQYTDQKQTKYINYTALLSQVDSKKNLIACTEKTTRPTRVLFKF